MATLLSHIQAVADEVGIPRPSAVITSADTQIQQLLQLSNREGRQLAQEHDWTILQRLATVTTANGTAEYDLPTDYSRLVPQTEWDRSALLPMRGPMDPREWQDIKSGGIGSGITGTRYRIYRSSTAGTFARKFTVDPTPTTAETLTFEYISTYWLTDTGGSTGRDAWAADTDIPLLDFDLLTLGVIIRFRRAKGLDFTSEADEYQQMFARKTGQDRPAKILSLTPKPLVRLLGPTNVPETGFGS